jgi:geranylgeranylglycerol-phosphate geranylgeranyltransferase
MAHPISSSKSPNWLDEVRAFSHLFRLSFSLIAAVAGSVSVYALNANLSIQSYILPGFILASMTAAACAINDYWDIDKDKINHPERPLPLGTLSRQQAWWSARCLFAIALIASIPLGFSTVFLVGVSTVLLWYYSPLLNYSGILGNFLVATIIALLLLFSSLTADRPFALLYPMVFLFFYALSREIVWDIHDADGDRARGVKTIPNVWGSQTAFLIVWCCICVLAISIPIATLTLDMVHPRWFAGCASILLFIFSVSVLPYQREQNQRNYERLVFWERFGLLFGVMALLGAAS